MASDQESDVSSIDDVNLSDGDESLNSPVGEVALQAVIDKIKPYLKDPFLNVHEVKNKLEMLGVTNLSDLSLLSPQDVGGLFKVVGFRSLLRDLSSAKSVTHSSQEDSRKGYIFKVKDVFSIAVQKKLKSKNMLQPHIRREVVHSLAADIHDNFPGPLKARSLLAVLTKLGKMYPVAFGVLIEDESQVRDMVGRLSAEIRDRVNYLRRLDRKRPFNAEDIAKFTKAQESGLDAERDLPITLPDTEDLNSLKQKRDELQTMFESGELVWATVRRCMAQTYVLQRQDINKKLLVDDFLKIWPFFGNETVFEYHFWTLMGTSESESPVRRKEDEVVPKWLSFFCGETLRKNRKGAAKDIPNKLNNILRYHKQIKENGESDKKSDFIAVILCIMAYLPIDTDTFFIRFNERSSFDEVQASPKMDAKPSIAVLGRNLLLNPKAFLVLEKRCISSEPVDLYTAIHQLFKSYFIFKFEWSNVEAPVLQFIGRKIYGMNQEDLTKTKRRRSESGYSHAAAPFAKKLLSLMKKVTEFQAHHDIIAPVV